ncbi:uncharacterized protein EAF01_005151 [Botrytis porri]|uniref:Uncharacterized protein n=1 Tax=Botrytis porri TaxID=87229 RepID=A0A4Z1KZ97_9HELO|nr:uncharacterized protein EAF01_005151 [Botrytis porri]KAF7907565.1 hypothetical protein EAF01_005151 [Botrytis porri]TGO89882.1 hypothetical protein BPOR_0089g00120 [Botrytis porri]
MTSNLSPEERRVIFTRHVDVINFTDPNPLLDLGKLSFPAWRNALIESFVEDKKTKDPNSFLPPRSRLEKMIRDKATIDADPGVILDVPEGYKGTPASYKNELKYGRAVEGGRLLEKYVPKGGDKDKVEWKLVVPGEEFWALFAERHLPSHVGRDKCFLSVGSKKYLPKRTIGAMIVGCCSTCRGRKKGKRELPVEGDVEEGPAAKRRMEVSQFDQALPLPAFAGEIGPGFVSPPRYLLTSPCPALYPPGLSNPDVGGSDINGENRQFHEYPSSFENEELYGGEIDNSLNVAASSAYPTPPSSSSLPPTSDSFSSVNTSFEELLSADDFAWLSNLDESFVNF